MAAHVLPHRDDLENRTSVQTSQANRGSDVKRGTNARSTNGCSHRVFLAAIVRARTRVRLTAFLT